MDHVVDDVQPRLACGPVPYVPEIVAWQATADAGLWDQAGGQYHSDRPPPFWAFAWPGGQALARYLLDRPEVVAGRRVLDVGAGSGLVAIAAARAGAAHVRAVDIDPAAVAAIGRNARANGVTVHAERADVLAGDGADAEVVLGGDIFYHAAIAHRAMPFARRAQRRGARVLLGDPQRGYLPAERFVARATYSIPVRAMVEGVPVRHTTVWELNNVT
jgi:predicted nicotinamide N-methyase